MPQLHLIQDLAVVLALAGAVAWLCQRLHISLVVGYLATGIAIGPFTPPFSLVTSLESVHTLANLGLIFVIFFVGMGLSLPRLRALGPGVLLATFLTALLVLSASRAAGAVLGLGTVQGLFLGSILVVSSSAIISKTLHELDATRLPFAQLALGITVLEDVVAVVMLAVLGSVSTVGGASTMPPIGGIVGRLAGFVLLVAAISVLFVPRLLTRLRRTSTAEIQTLWVGGLLLAVAWLAARAGFSLALGAFVLGSIVGGTAHKARIEQAFEGLRDIFAAIFFVSMGMLFDVRVVATAWPMVLALTAFALVVRWAAATASLLIVGRPTRIAVQAGLTLLPLGEFSFVIAQLGVSTGVMPAAFYPAAVGAALITTLVSPVLTRFGTRAGDAAERHEPLFVRAWGTAIGRATGALRQRRERSFVWQVLAGRIGQAAFEVALLLSALVFSGTLYGLLERWLGPTWRFAPWLPVIFWTGLGLVLLVPLVALWRNLGALGMVLGEALASGAPQQRLLQPLIERAVQVGGALLVLLMGTAFVPSALLRPLVLVPVLGAAVILALVMRGPLIRWYSRFQVEVRNQLAEAPGGSTAAVVHLPPASSAWTLRVHEHVLSDLSPAAGRTLRESALRSRFGCTLACVDRQGITLLQPSADAVLYPNDKLLLVGTDEQIAAAEGWLKSAGDAAAAGTGFGELITETAAVPARFPHAGQTLAQMSVAGQFGVLVLGIERNGKVVENPSGEQVVTAGDSLLILGTAPQLRAFRGWLQDAGSKPEGASA